MRIGVMAFTPPGATVHDWASVVEEAEADGFDAAWLPNIFAADALTALTLAGQATSRITLGTFVVPTYPRHPFALAQQALSVQAATGNRLVLGIGLGHRVSMGDMLGFDWDHPIRHTREYLSCLVPLLRQEPTHFAGEEFRLNGAQLTVPGAEPPQVLVAALGPQMLKVTGTLADGTAIWMGGTRYIAEQAVPEINRAAAAAGRPAPRIVAGLPVCVTDHPGEVRERAARAYARYGQLPSYRAILDKAGADSPADVALIGSAAEVREGLRSLVSAGVTDFAAAIFAPSDAERAATVAVLREA